MSQHSLTSLVRQKPLRFIPLLLLNCLAFGQHGKGNTDQMLPSFVVVPGAANVRHYELQSGRKQLSYRVRVEYPAQAVLDRIQRELKRRGWVPQPQDYLNPAQKSSIVRGWDYYEDRATQPATSVQVWQADWRHNSELVTYRLEYRCPDSACASTRDLRELRVIAIYTAHPYKAYQQ